MKSIKWTRAGIGVGFGYFKNDICKLEDKTAEELIETGYAIPFIVDELSKKMPYRDILSKAGYKTDDEVKALSTEQLVEIEGIDDKKAEAILKFFSK